MRRTRTSGFLAIVCLLVIRCYDGCLASSWLVGGEPLVPAEQRPPSPRRRWPPWIGVTATTGRDSAATATARDRGWIGVSVPNVTTRRCVAGSVLALDRAWGRSPRSAHHRGRVLRPR